jgi:hypothetical protein
VADCEAEGRACLFVDLRAVVEAVLAGAGNGPGHAGRVPGADAGHLAQTAVRLTRQTRNAPARDDALGAAALGDSDSVDHVVLLHHRVHRDLHVCTGHAACSRGSPTIHDQVPVSHLDPPFDTAVQRAAGKHL